MLKQEMFMELRTGETRGIRYTPLRSSAGAGWNGFQVESHRSEPFEVKDVCCLDHVIFLQLDVPVTMEWNTDEPPRQVLLRPGQVSLLPAYVPYSARCAKVHQFLMVRLEQKFLHGAAVEFGALDHPALNPALGFDDPFMREVLCSLKAEMETGQAEGGLYAESLATVLAVHLVCKHSARPAQMPQDRGGLGKAQLRRIVEFVHERFAGEISLNQLASIAGLSPYHFARQFRRAAGLPPHEYVTRLRVERAKELLLRPFASLADVAVQAGFYDQSHLARHFKRRFSLTPMAFVRRALDRKIVL
ncbi:MAG: helix-turn-helix domain-containing protein [Limisphaerales bacterium]